MLYFFSELKIKKIFLKPKNSTELMTMLKKRKMQKIFILNLYLKKFSIKCYEIKDMTKINITTYIIIVGAILLSGSNAV